MAQRKTYRCKQCGYECYDYEGTGFMRQHIVSVSCPDCHTIQPLVVGGIIGNNAPSSVPQLRQQPYRDVGPSHLPQVWRRDGLYGRDSFLDLDASMP